MNVEPLKVIRARETGRRVGRRKIEHGTGSVRREIHITFTVERIVERQIIIRRQMKLSVGLNTEPGRTKQLPQIQQIRFVGTELRSRTQFEVPVEA